MSELICQQVFTNCLLCIMEGGRHWGRLKEVMVSALKLLTV